MKTKIFINPFVATKILISWLRRFVVCLRVNDDFGEVKAAKDAHFFVLHKNNIDIIPDISQLLCHGKNFEWGFDAIYLWFRNIRNFNPNLRHILSKDLLTLVMVILLKRRFFNIKINDKLARLSYTCFQAETSIESIL